MIKKILLNFLSLLFRFIPRNQNLWVTGKITSWEYDNAPPAFFDNSKHFFLYLVNNTDEKVYWLSSSKREIDLLKSMDLPVVKYPSIRGIYLVLRAKFSFHHYGPYQIDAWLQRGSTQLDFWHGTPLKKIRYDITDKPPEEKSAIHKFLDKKSVEYVFSTSKYLSENVLAGAFDIGPDKLLNFGYPRMDVMGLKREENLEFCKKYSPELLPYIEKTSKYENVMLYMPTFRDDDPEYFEKAEIDFDAMSDALKSINGILFLKLHPLTSNSNIKTYENIVQISNDVDIYPFLDYTDYLITDYSSIYFDYLVLDKEMIFIPYDYENYVSKRALYFDYDKITPGKKYLSFREFIDDMENIPHLDYHKERAEIGDLMIDEYNFDSCKRTYEFVCQNLKK